MQKKKWNTAWGNNIWELIAFIHIQHKIVSILYDVILSSFRRLINVEMFKNFHSIRW